MNAHGTLTCPRCGAETCWPHSCDCPPKPAWPAEHVHAVDTALALVRSEYLRAAEKFPPFNSAHEGYAVSAEEIDELWDDVKSNQNVSARQEAVQVAAMAIRFIIDVHDKPETTQP